MRTASIWIMALVFAFGLEALAPATAQEAELIGRIISTQQLVEKQCRRLEELKNRRSVARNKIIELKAKMERAERAGLGAAFTGSDGSQRAVSPVYLDWLFAQLDNVKLLERKIEDIDFAFGIHEQRKDGLKKALKKYRDELREMGETGGAADVLETIKPQYEQTKLDLAALIEDILRDLAPLRRVEAEIEAIERSEPDLEPVDLSAGDLGAAGTGKTTLQEGTIGRTDSYIDRVSVLFGGVGKSDLTFGNFGQRINTNDRWSASLDVAFGGPIIRDNQIYYTLNYTHIEMDQNTHTNVAGGAVGPSRGKASFDYLGVGLAMEREIDRFGTLGLGAGIGALVHDVSGSFRASGTTGAIKLDAYSRHRLSPRVTAGPFVSVILPLDDVSGGAGAAVSRYDADPLFLLGLRLDLMPF